MKRSYFIAAGIVVVVTLWMLSGLLVGGGATPDRADGKDRPLLTRVEVRAFSAQPMLREIVMQGQTLPRRNATLKAEILGEVAEVLVEKGRTVRRGEVLLRLAANELPQQLEQARALVKQRELEYEASRSLKDKGLQAERQLAEALSLLQVARAQLKSAELNLARVTIRAPFASIVHQRYAELGDYLQPGDPIYSLVVLDPLRVRGDVSENEVGELEVGMEAVAELSNGARLAGTITYIAPLAESSTRTFAVEIEAANPAPSQPGGMSATLRIPLEAVPAHRVSPALLSLNDEGVVGVKSVDEQGVVQFHPAEILKSGREGVWLGGLPEEVEVITVGQGFVREGDRVEAVRGETGR
ncbi:MAG: efflux RND transporter periplasmic adaptor subunit [Gammaproteobacteria bacterium]|nr:efflux RND transporter periplasmic adaptor subunit [Gammaproteobacteria bacterium]MCW8840201.1 efflux RND transporter periplasmic adaptor subunit [Gammaproteobacteria bacterium]MCW8959040.1 efflux RND transporter periplasmic adaptor subunit [Gammaproteobacteria bacterium]MCW8973208.1 efflux RND transporter periplasmic adaptor subunit [Gammaproteobacteria bacterium]MCW8993953.1 efflux RND transporter periplasmic adaptor subunit [Gammaproteobacteria bacterium]